MIWKFHNSNSNAAAATATATSAAAATHNTQMWQLFWSFAHQWQFVLHKYGLSNKISSRRRPSNVRVSARYTQCPGWKLGDSGAMGRAKL